MRRTGYRAIWVTLVCVSVGIVDCADAGTLPLSTAEIDKYLLIGLGPGSKGDAIDIDNGEMGSHKAGAPIDSGFTSGGSTFPNLLGNVPDIPTNALPVFAGIDSSGNMALTDSTGTFNLSNVGIYADLGIHAAASAGTADNGKSNTFYYDASFTDVTDSDGFPNTLDSFTAANPGGNGHNNTSATGTNVSTGSVSSSFDLSNGNGLTGSVDLSALDAEIAAAKATIPMLNPIDNPDVSFGTIDLGSGFSDGSIDKSMHPSDKGFGISGDITAAASSSSDGGTFLVTLQNTGLTVIDFDVDAGKDITVSNYNFVIDGPVGSQALIRVPDDSAFLTSQGNVLAGTGGIGLGNIVIASLNEVEETHFGIQNSVINGVAMWSLTMEDGVIDIDNAQGCAQFIADSIDISNARFTHCGSGPTFGGPLIPEPSTLALGLVAGLALFSGRRRPGR